MNRPSCPASRSFLGSRVADLLKARTNQIGRFWTIRWPGPVPGPPGEESHAERDRV